MKKIKLSKWAKDNDIKYLAAYKMAKKNLILTETLPTGTILVLIQDEIKEKIEKVAIYCRVSSSAEKNTTLQTQKERLLAYCAAKGYKIAKVVTETGSGLNDNRKQWLDILCDDTITKIVVEHKDRFSRFGFNAFQEILKIYNREIEVINETENDKEDLIQDFISIITSYCSKIYGSRRSKRKTEKIIKELENK